MRSFIFKIDHRHFDIYAMNSGIEDFCAAHLLDRKKLHNIELALEELLINNILPNTGAVTDIELKVKYSEESGKVELELLYAGPELNPFAETSGGDEISMRILNKLASNVFFEHKKRQQFPADGDLARRRRALPRDARRFELAVNFPSRLKFEGNILPPSFQEECPSAQTILTPFPKE